MNEDPTLVAAGTTADTLHRGVKLLLDSEDVTQEEAEHILQGYRLRCVVGPEIASSPTLQAALLTIVNTAHRCCLGGVFVEGIPDGAPLLLPTQQFGGGIAGAVVGWGGVLAGHDGDMPTLVLGSPAVQTTTGWPVLQVGFNGWIGEVQPYSGASALVGREFILSGVLSGAVAVSECFQSLRGTAGAMRRRVRRSLWTVSGNPDAADGAGPESYVLPTDLWLLGLGHLGQACLWCQMLLPYSRPGDVRLVLNDYDRITTANLSTSLLSQEADVGKRKTRHLAAVLEARGFNTIVQERAYDGNFTRATDDPQILLCGVDTPRIRRLIGKAGFPEVIEAGLGHSAEAYLDFQLHTFPAKRLPEDVWAESRVRLVVSERHHRQAYQDMVSRGVDQCGIVEIAGKAVGAPFVGAYVAAMVLAEAIKSVSGGPRIEVADGSLNAPERIKCYPRMEDAPVLNLGFQQVAR